MKKFFILLSAFTSCAVFGQHEFSSFTATGRGGATSFVTDYQAVGINPANLGWASKYEDKKFTMGLGEFSYSAHSEVLTKQELRDAFSATISGDSLSAFTYDEKLKSAQEFANSGMALDMDLGSFGFAYNDEKFGGIAFRINDQFNWYSRFNETTSEILFLGKLAPYFDSLVYVDPTSLDTSQIANYENISQDSMQHVVSGFTNSPNPISEIINGTHISFSWMREYNLSYGRQFFEIEDKLNVYGGIGLKYMQGFGYVDIKSEDNVLSAFSSISPIFPIDYGGADSLNPSAVVQPEGSFMPKPVGSGFGVDLGLSFIIADKVKIGLAYTNIGSMTWNGNVYSINDTSIYDTESAGLQNYSIFQQLGDVTGDEGLFEWQGIEEKKVSLPSTFRLGASFKVKEKAELGVDVIVPTNEGVGNIQKAVIGLGGDLYPLPWLRLSAGFLTGGNYDSQIPVGITFVAGDGSWEAGFASRDAITFFSQNGPTLSLSLGFMRFRF